MRERGMIPALGRTELASGVRLGWSRWVVDRL